MPVENVIARISQIESRLASLTAAPPRPAAAGRFESMLASASAPVQVPGAPASAVSGPWAALGRPEVASASGASAPITGNEKALTPDQLNGVLLRAGFRGDALRTAWAIAMRESGGQPGLTGPVNGNGTRDHGLFQFNDVHRGSWLDFSRVYDAEYAAQAAFRMSNGGTDFSAWALGDSGWAGQLQERNPEVYQKLYGMWKEYYDQYPSAVGQA